MVPRQHELRSSGFDEASGGHEDRKPLVAALKGACFLWGVEITGAKSRDTQYPQLFHKYIQHI